MKTRTLLGFPAPHLDDEIPVVLDDSDVQDEPTLPHTTPPDRPTGRPSGELQASLIDASRDDPPWLPEPRFSVDPTSGRLVLAEPYSARQSDQFGNVFVVECWPGLELPPPGNASHARALRSELVAASLRERGIAHVVRGRLHIPLAIDDQWRVEIVTAFREGDAGVRRRG